MDGGAPRPLSTIGIGCQQVALHVVRDAGFERRRVRTEHASPLAVSGQTVPHLIDIPLSTGTTVVGRMQLHLAEGVVEPDLLATATLNNIGHQLAASIQIGQLVRGLQRTQHEDHRLYEVLLQVADQGDLAETLAMVVRDARELLGADDAAMCLNEAGTRAIQYDGAAMQALLASTERAESEGRRAERAMDRYFMLRWLERSQGGTVTAVVVDVVPRPIVVLDETLMEQPVPSLVGAARGDRVRLKVERVNPRADLLVLRPA